MLFYLTINDANDELIE